MNSIKITLKRGIKAEINHPDKKLILKKLFFA